MEVLLLKVFLAKGNSLSPLHLLPGPTKKWTDAMAAIIAQMAAASRERKKRALLNELRGIAPNKSNARIKPFPRGKVRKKILTGDFIFGLYSIAFHSWLHSKCESTTLGPSVSTNEKSGRKCCKIMLVKSTS